MANYYGQNYTDAFQDDPSEKIDSGKANSSIKVLSDEFEVSAALTTSDSLFMGKLPKGAKVFEVILRSDDMGTAGDFNVGWDAGTNGLETADPNGFLSAVDVNAAAAVHRMSDSAADADTGLIKEMLDEVNVIIQPSETCTATSGNIKLVVLYSI